MNGDGPEKWLLLRTEMREYLGTYQQFSINDEEFARKLRKVKFSLVTKRGLISLDVKRNPGQDKPLSIDLPLLAPSKFGLPLLRTNSVLCLFGPLVSIFSLTSPFILYVAESSKSFSITHIHSGRLLSFLGRVTYACEASIQMKGYFGIIQLCIGKTWASIQFLFRDILHYITVLLLCCAREIKISWNTLQVIGLESQGTGNLMFCFNDLIQAEPAFVPKA